MKWIRKTVHRIASLYLWAYLILYIIGKDTHRHAQIALWTCAFLIVFNAIDELVNGKPKQVIL